MANESISKISKSLRSLGVAMIEMSEAILTSVEEEQSDEWLTSEAAAELMQCSKQAANNRAKAGKIDGRKMGRDYVFSRRSIENYMRINHHLS